MLHWREDRLNALHTTNAAYWRRNQAPNQAKFGTNYDGFGDAQESGTSVVGRRGARPWTGVLASRFPPALRAATTERIVVDRHTGLGDLRHRSGRVFHRRKPIAGRAEFEHRHAGAIWRFDNEGNRAAFIADPDVYMPRYGGYDPVGIARGVSTAGFPELWVVLRRAALSLLYGRGARETFMANPAPVIAVGRRRAGPRSRANWRSSLHALARHRGDRPTRRSPAPESPRAVHRRDAPPSGAVTTPPAATTTACPAATSHSEVGASRG